MPSARNNSASASESLRRRLIDPAPDFGYIANDQLIQRFDDSMSRYLYSDGEVAAAMSATKPKPLTSAMAEKLDRATRSILMSLRNRSESSNRGRRESQYGDLARAEKVERMTAREIAESELPFLIGHLSREKLQELARSGRLDGFGLNPNGKFNLVCTQNGCGIDATTGYSFAVLGRLYCAEHVPQNEICIRCSHLMPTCQLVRTFEGVDVFACANCLMNVTHCSNCSDPIDAAYVQIGLCQGCIDNPGDGAPYRNFSYSLKWTGAEEGTIVKSPRLYSSEIEAVFPTSSRVHVFAQSIPNECGISTDGSIDGDGGYGFETQTPRLQGKKGEELMHRVGAALKEGEAVVNKSCGMHIHLDGKGIISPSRKEFPTALLQLWKTHLVFEDVIMAFLPYARRRNDYCRPMGEDFKLAEVDTCESLLDAEKLWYKQTTYREIRDSKRHHYHSSRYFGVNFHSLLGYGHLEIRYHSGTTNPRKVLEWANFHALIMDAAAAKKLTPDFLKEALATSRLRDKTELLFEKIGLAESSRQYFRARQKKFGNKEVEESNSI